MQDLSLQHAGFSPVVVCRFSLLWLWRTGSRVHGLCSLRHVGSLVEAQELSSCGTRAQVPRGMWEPSSPTRDRTRVPCIGRQILYHWTTREVPGQYFKIDISYSFTMMLKLVFLFMYILQMESGDQRGKAIHPGCRAGEWQN